MQGIQKVPISNSKNKESRVNAKPAKSQDPYTVPRDYIWKDVVVHERGLNQAWAHAWGRQCKSTAPAFPENTCCQNVKTSKEKNYDKGKDENEPVKPTRQTLLKSTGFQSQVPTIDYRKLFWTPGPLPRIRFVSEQYGHYRKLRYLRDQSRSKKSSIAEPSPEISSLIKYRVNPLLC